MLKHQQLVVLRVEHLRRKGPERDPGPSPEPGRDCHPSKGRRRGSESGLETPDPEHLCLRTERDREKGLGSEVPFS